MSDVSESLQVRTDADEACIERLREIRFDGFAFRGGRGWLSLVPYGQPGSMIRFDDRNLAEFSARLMAPVINYNVNDFSWSFQLALPDGRMTGFGRWLVDPADVGLSPEQARMPHLDETVLAAVVRPSVVSRFVGATALPLKEGFEYELFAEALGFPRFNQFNPTYATEHPDEMRKLGGIEIGHRPEFMKRDGLP